MAKFSGRIGFAMQEETAPGVFRERVIERPCRGDLIRFTRRSETSDKLNDDLNISNEISILADGFTTDNFQYLRYVHFMGARWKITSVQIEYPRLILSIGGLYNGPKPQTRAT